MVQEGKRIGTNSSYSCFGAAVLLEQQTVAPGPCRYCGLNKFRICAGTGSLNAVRLERVASGLSNFWPGREAGQVAAIALPGWMQLYGAVGCWRGSCRVSLAQVSQSSPGLLDP